MGINTTMAQQDFDTVIIGAGVIGLACAAALAQAGDSVLIAEAGSMIGGGISSRNSEVIHAGIYYPQGSLKARACVQGNAMLQDYARAHQIPYRMVGKLIVAAHQAEEKTLSDIAVKAQNNDVNTLLFLSGAEARQREPQLQCTAALYSPQTGVIDTHALMLSLLGKAQDHGAMIAYNCPVLSGEHSEGLTTLQMGDSDKTILRTRRVVIAAGLSSSSVATSLGLQNIPPTYLCKGDYFSLSGAAPFTHLVYPVPVAGGLGIHYTLDMAGRGRFGPDVTWIAQEHYDVADDKRALFAQAVQRYWPGCRAENLQPAYAGIRPKIVPQGHADADFTILDETAHGSPGVIALLGIESPGLTSSLALAAMVTQRLQALAR